MKLLLTALMAIATTSAAYAGEYNQNRGWGVSPTASTGRSTNHYNYGAIAGQVQDGSGLTGSPTINQNYAIGNWITNTVNGNGNTVGIDATNNGNVTAGQQNGGANGSQTMNLGQ